MRRPLAIFLGWRYSRARQGRGFISFISLASMLGIALGVMVLITVLSVMNGFDDEIHKRFFGMAAEVTIQKWDGAVDEWQTLISQVEKDPAVRTVAPYIGGQGLIVHAGQVLPIILSGVDFAIEENFNNFSKKIIAGSLNNIDNYGVVLGKELALNIGANIGDKITIMIPEASSTPLGMQPRFKRFTVAAIFSAGTGFSFDAKMAFIDLKNAQILFQIPNKVTGLKLKLFNIDNASAIAWRWQRNLGERFQVGSWNQQFGDFFHAVKLEKNMMFLILALIIAVASFNLVSSLVMVVNDKRAEIAIMRTLGLSPGHIIAIFVVQGAIIGLIGTFLGVALGLILANHVTQIVDYLQNFFNLSLVSSNIYFVDYLPSKIHLKDVLQVTFLSAVLSFLATIYPAWRASRILIVEGLHHDV